ncbi:hypothetical protein [Glaciibacter superstes]|uniref:hypothetical protein n=1 Tax=Glaciibacter superstes TaxID=501023 RepID=UPI0003B454CF|nr:hypothetical protein [Glaciibacter superstes]
MPTTPAHEAEHELNAAGLRTMAADAAFPLAEDRLPAVLETLRGLRSVIGRLDGVPLGSTPPAVGFDPRWR